VKSCHGCLLFPWS